MRVVGPILDISALLAMMGLDATLFSLGGVNVLYIGLFFSVVANTPFAFHFLLGPIKKYPFMILSFVVLSGFSLTWSAEAILGAGILAELVVTTYFAIAFSKKYTAMQFAKLLNYSVLLVIVISIVSIILAPSVGLHQSGPDAGVAWAGLFIHKNSFARNIFIGLSAVLFLMIVAGRQKKFFYSALLVFYVATLYMTRSGTVYFAVFYIFFLFALSFFLPGRVSFFSAKNIYLALPFLPMIMTASSFLYYSVLDFLGRGGGDGSTFGVREHLWMVAAKDAMERPFLGYGLGGYWSSGGQELSVYEGTSRSWVAYQAHNGFLEHFLNFGLLGLLMLAATLLIYRKRASLIFNHDPVLAWGLIGFGGGYMILNSAYSNLVAQVSLPWLVFSFLYLKSAKGAFEARRGSVT